MSSQLQITCKQHGKTLKYLSLYVVVVETNYLSAQVLDIVITINTLQALIINIAMVRYGFNRYEKFFQIFLLENAVSLQTLINFNTLKCPNYYFIKPLYKLIFFVRTPASIVFFILN